MSLAWVARIHVPQYRSTALCTAVPHCVPHFNVYRATAAVQF